MSTLKLSPNDKLQIVNIIDTNEDISNIEIAKLLSNKIKGISPLHVVKVKSTYKKDKFKYREFLELSLVNSKKVKVSGIQTTSAGFGKQDNMGDGFGKQIARQKILNAVKFSKDNFKLSNGTYLMLPSNTFGIVNEIYNNVSKRFKYTFCQRIDTNCSKRKLKDISIVQSIIAQYNNFGKQNKTFIGDLSELIYNADKNSIDHIGADYCGELATFEDEIKHACLSDIIKVGGTIQITVKRQNRASSEFTKKFLKFPLDVNELSKDDVSMSEIANYKFFKCLEVMTNFKMVEYFTYNDSTPMMLIILRRVK